MSEINSEENPGCVKQKMLWKYRIAQNFDSGKV